MSKKFLNFFIQYSSFLYSVKKRVVEERDVKKTVLYAVELLGVEILLFLISLPLFIMVPPERLQERGFIFPRSEKEPDQANVYIIRRKISLVTVLGAGGLFLVKVLFVAIVSSYLLGVQPLLAATQNWDFTTPGDYTYDSAKIEVTGGVARLKNTSASGSSTNGGFNTDATGWTYNDWLEPSNTTANGSFVSSGGNPGGFVRVDLTSDRRNKTVAGFWMQSFTTTVANPASATLTFDWKADTFVSPTNPTTFQVYAFINNSSGNPIVTQNVWGSGEITGTTSWASTSSINIASKLTTAGTYYLKVAVYATSPNVNTTYAYSGVIDNISMNWSQSASPVYATDNPAINPTTSLIPTTVSTWDSFTETATKNGGEIYYQLSDDNGSSWQYWNGSAWVTAGASNYNTATVVNTNIGTFSTSAGKIMWKAFLSGNGSQQVILDNIAIGYTENTAPTISNLSPSQQTSNGRVYVNYDLVDNESDPSSLVTYEYSTNGSTWQTMTADTGDPNHEGVSGLTASPGGTAHTFVWDAGADLGAVYSTTVQVRLQANDGIVSGATTTSSSFTVDYALPVVSNVSAAQTVGTTNVQIAYDVADDSTSDLLIELDISDDGGTTWNVTDISVSGSVGSGQSTGASKTITWNAGTDFDEQQQADIQVRVRAKDRWQNQGTNVASANFSLDTLNPVTNVAANLQAQPNAGDTSVLISGSFTEINPNTNDFYVAINGGAYGSATSGTSDTATPSDQVTGVGATLDGNDYIPSVKIVHTDDYGQSVTNENASPNTAYKYVRPYTPLPPTVDNPLTTRVDVTVNKNGSETDGLEYAIFETSQSKYVQSDGTLGTSAVWQTLGTGAGQWGDALAVSGKVRVTGLSSPVSLYIFKTKSRNTSDTSHAASSESALSAAAQITNTAPVLSIPTGAQTTDGTQYTSVDYTGTDGEGDINSLATYQYSRDSSTWSVMAEKSGVGSDGIANLTFLPTGSSHTFKWDSGTDLSNIEDSTVYVRLKSNDTQSDSNLAISSAFEIDNKSSVVSAVTASQNSGERTVAIQYNLADANNSLVELSVSQDGGATWTVTSTTTSGAVGSGITPGTGKTITWDAGADFDGQYQADMRVRVRGRDTFGNQGSYAESSDFTLDTKDPVISNVTAGQDSGADTFTFHYDISDDQPTTTVGSEISSDGGSTWTVPTTSAAGDTGAGQTSGTGKTITWDGATDYNDQEKTTMKIRLTATDSFTNASSGSSSNFSLDTKAPRVTNVSAAQTSGATTVTITYDLADQSNSTIEFDVSSNGGSTWTVPDTTASGAVGAGIPAGNGKTITWDAGTDFGGQLSSTMRVRVRGRDVFNNQSANAESSNFSLDTTAPVSNVTVDLQAQPQAGDTTALIGGSFTETNPNTNSFYTAINGGAYGSATAGQTNTATPADQATGVGATLDGNDYISKVKIVHTDDYGQSVTNENTSPNTAYKYVKPYTPAAPTVDNPGFGTVDVTINKNASETDGLEYAIFETSQNKYVQSNGTLGASAVWQTLGTASGQWGNGSGTSGKVTVTGLTTSSYLHQFKVKSRNTNDAAHAASSESALSSGASSANQAPSIAFNSVSEITNGSKYVTISYTGTDLEDESSNIVYYKYSLDNLNWSTMTEKSGVGSDGILALAFTHTGAAFDFMWDVGGDLPNTEDTNARVRLQANDGTSTGALATSSIFTIDTKNPVISAISVSQTSGTKNVAIGYTLTDLSVSSVELQISSDGGLTWTVPTTSASGDVGGVVSPGSGKSITWNAGTDFNNQDSSTMKVRLRSTDAYGNAGSFTTSGAFSVDTSAPAISNVTASQDAGAGTVTIHYDISDTNTSTVGIDISEDGGTTWGVATTTLSGDVGAGVTSGTGKTVSWTASTDFPNREQSLLVRVHATDVYSNANGNVQSSAFTVDTKAPVITNVSALQTLGTRIVVFTYDISDAQTSTVALDISSDNGTTWTVTDTSVTGSVGAGISAGTGKTISWDAGTDFPNQVSSTMKVRIRSTDSFANASGNTVSSSCSLDTLPPTVSVAADLQAQPNAGDTTALIGGLFTETNPNTNDFYLAINGGAYGSATAGQGNTATPTNQATAVGATLTGSDYISKVKITHTDDYGQSVTSEDTSPNTAYTYVKPYTPVAPTVANPQNTSVDVTVNAHSEESATVEYSIYEQTTNKYVQSDGTLGMSAVWKTLGTGAGQWGQTSGVSGKVSVTGLTSPVAQYSFNVISRNPSDGAHAASSQSSMSASGSITNTAPVIALTSISQVAGGTTIIIDYTGTDTQNDTNSLLVREYSTDGSAWQTMTEKSGAGSDGTTNLLFSSAGSAYTFAWDLATDLPNTEDSTVFVRLQSSDTLANSNTATSSAFAIDTRGPSISTITTSQTPATSTIVINYDMSDVTSGNNSVTLEISDDGGTTWTVPTLSATGDLGSGVAAGTGREISWNAGSDFANEEQSDMRIRLRGTDYYGNVGDYAPSSIFTVDTKAPVVSAVSATQTAGSNSVVISYTLSDITSAGHTVEISISEDGGATWVVPTTSATGDVGSGVTTGTKSITWNAGTDFSGQYQTDMRVRVRSRDYFNNQGSYTQSSNFTVDTAVPTITNTSASQTVGSGTIVIHYDLADSTGTGLNVTLDVSEDGGTTWTVAHPTTSGNVGTGQTTGTGKTITWNSDTDFDNQYQTDMRVRLRATDSFANTSAYAQSSNFTLDTANPVVSNVTASQNTGSDLVTIAYDLADDSTTGLTVNIDISDDGGATWTVPTTTLSGDVGTGQTSGTGKSVTWNAGTDFGNQFQTDVRVRVSPTDNFANQGTQVQSSNFTVDTSVPTISNVTAAQSANTNSVLITYDLADSTGSNLSVALDISQDGGTTWTVAHPSTSGNVGASQTAGTGKTITWDAGTDFDNQYQTDMRVRLRATDNFANTSAYAQSANFTLDTANPTISNVTASQPTGSGSVTVTYDLADNTGTGLNVTLDVSEDGGTTWTVAHPTTSGNVGTGQTTGVGKTITWNSDTDFDNQYQTDMRVRLRATDSFANISAYAQSANFTLDTANPVVSNVTASQNTGSDLVTIAYDLADDSTTGLTVNIDISDDGGATWTVPTTTLSGDVGTGQTSGTGKSVTWNAGVDFSGNEQSDLRARVRGVDNFANIGAFTSSSNFLIDTKAPVVSAQSNLQAQPNAGDTTVLISGSFTDANPNSNNFSVALNGGAYGTATAGDSNTATPSNQATAVGTTLKGNNYVSKVKLVHTDDYGHATTNENTSPTIAYVYVKPYTPATPTVNTPTVNSVHVIVNKNASEVTGLEYVIFESTTAKYVQTDGTLGTSPAWQTIALWGTKTVTGLSSPVANYVFQTKSRNSSDASHATTSESALSAGASIGNTAPVVTLGSITQVVGQRYVTINYTGTDAQNDTNILITTEYSLNNTTWFPMTEKSSVGSDGKTSLAFTSAGASFMFAWDIATDIPNTESDTAYIRIKANDGLLDGNLATSSAFSADTKAPVFSNVTASQPTGSGSVTVTYDLADNTGTGLSVTLDVSEDGGTTWTVAHPTTSGNVGTGQTTGVGKTITWNSDTDFDNQYQTDMRVRLRATDSFANISAYAQSANFTLDTANPVVSNVTASQNTGSDLVTIAYDLADDSTTGLTVTIDISEDGGATWTVPTTTLTGDVGTGQTSGTGKSVTWNAGTDFAGNEQSDLRARVRGVDNFANIGSFTSSSNFLIDTKAPVVSAITASQTTGTADVVIHYTLTDTTSAGQTVDMQISSDGGTTWTVPVSSASGDVGSGLTAGSKTITWSASVDYNGHAIDNLRVRIRSRDLYGNQGAYTQSGTLSLDSLAPALSSLTAVQDIGTELIRVHYVVNDDSQPLRVVMETSSDGGLTWNVLTPTTTGSIGASVTSGAGKLITWNAGVDYNDQEKSQMRIRLTGIDSFGNTSAPLSSSDFILDTAPPAGLSAFSQFLATTSSISFVWASGVTDAHFNRYELWYGTVQGDVEGRTGGARKWSTENDSALALSATNATTIGTGLQQGTDYFVELYAFDDNGSGSTTAGIYARLASPQAAVVFGTVLPTPLPTVTAPTLVPVPGPTPQAPSIPQPATIILPEVRPTLTALTTPTNNTNTAISGLASPGSAIELYDAGTLIARLSAPANNQGEFQQTILLGSGAHALTVKSLDASGSRSDASLPVPLTIDTTSPSAPIITSPLNGEIVSTDILTLAGAGEPRVTLEITLDGSRRFTTAVNPAGTWSFILPDAFALLAGGHTFSVVARDEAGNSSPASNVSVTRIILPILITPVISRVTPIPVQRPLVSIPIARPAAELIREVSTAIEVPSLPPPQVVTASTATTTAPGLFTNDIIDFSGTALPNEDVIIYIHSEQAVIYRAKADSAGKWTFKHSQNEIELTPGVHTIYAVGLDPVAKVKTRPSLVKTFVVEKNWWVVIYNYLNFYSTAVSLIVILLILAWLYRREHRTRTVS